MADDRKRWERLNELLARALEQATDDRAAWVASECRDDPGLKAELLELLSYDVEETGGLHRAIANASARASESFLGKTVGNYRVTDRIAEGGMGAVYLGEREGADFEQRVAIKIMHGHVLDETTQARFVAERRILASLTHPNIAGLIDGGMAESGVPYIVMEYIDGENIADYCARRELDNDTIIRLVINICNAVQYAHSKLVIHRDIKPSNILVEADGTPRLLDFGIAKLLHSDGRDDSQTQTKWRALTPLYASPEQLGGQPISTAADVYGIGLLLYRLLTGRMPYTPTGDRPRDVEDAILSSPAEPPSSAVTQSGGHVSSQWVRRQQRALRGDLDTILLTALRKEPERRYPTVNAFAADLERYLDKLPIRARKDSFAYRAGKFIDRHRVPVALSAAFVAFAVGLTAVYTQRLRAEREIAEQTAGFLSGLFEASDPYSRNREGLTVEGLVEDGARKIEADASLTPAVRARLLRTLAAVYQNLGNFDRADELIQEALSMMDGAAGVSTTDRYSALVTLSDIRNKQGRHEEALETLARAIDMGESEFGRRSLPIAKALSRLAYIQYRLGDYDAMKRAAEDSLTIRESLLPENDASLASAHNMLGMYYRLTGNLAEAEKHYATILQIQDAQPERNDLAYAGTLHNLGLVQNDIGNYEAAADSYRRSIALRRKAAGESDPYLPYALYSLAHTMVQMGRFAEAQALFQEQLPLQIASTGENHDMVAYALVGHGHLLADMGATELAAASFERAMAIYESIGADPEGPEQAAALIGLAKVARARGDLQAAEAHLERAVRIRSTQMGEAAVPTQAARITLADLYLKMDRRDDARSALATVLDEMRRQGDDQHPVYAKALTLLARIELADGNGDMAIDELESAIELTAPKIGSDHLDNVDRRLLLADALLLAGRTDEARDLRARASARRAQIDSEWQAALGASVSADGM